MTRINLLPWREQRREQRKRRFLAALGGSLVLGIGLIALADQYFNWAIEQQEARNTLLRTQIALLDKQIKEFNELQKRRQQYLERIKIIQDLQVRRPIAGHIFDQLIRTLPEGVHFTESKMAGNTLSLTGIAESNARVSSLMRNLDASAWLSAPNLAEVKAINLKHGRQGSQFRLTVLQVQPPPEAPSSNAEDSYQLSVQ